ncbi:MAG: glycosyltransferase [Pseudomonadota bacterium]
MSASREADEGTGPGASDRVSPAETSVVIVTEGHRPAGLADALAGLARLDRAAREILIVGPRGAREAARAVAAQTQLCLPKTVRHVQAEAGNISAARNAGIAGTTGQLVAFIDDDAVPEPGWLDALCAGFLAPDIAAVGGFTKTPDGAWQWRAEGVDMLGRTVPLVAPGDAGTRPNPAPGTPPGVAPGLAAPADPNAVAVTSAAPHSTVPHSTGPHITGPHSTAPYVPTPPAGIVLRPVGTCSAYRRAALTAIGGFDERFRFYLDDADMAVRLARAGWRLALSPQAVVRHGLAASPRRDRFGVPRDLTEIGASQALFLARYAGAARDQGLREFRTLWRMRLARRMQRGTLAPDTAAALLRSLDEGFHRGLHRHTLPPAMGAGSGCGPAG